MLKSEKRKYEQRGRKRKEEIKERKKEKRKTKKKECWKQGEGGEIKKKGYETNERWKL